MHRRYYEEKILGSYFMIDVEVKIDLSEKELLTDNLSATYNYEWIPILFKKI